MNKADMDKYENIRSRRKIHRSPLWKQRMCFTKMQFETEEDAIRHATDYENLKCYKCPICKKWHTARK